MRIRKATKKDAEQVAKLYMQFWKVHKNKNILHQPAWEINPKNVLKDSKEMIRSKDYLLYLAEENGEIAGFILFTIKTQDSWYWVRRYCLIEELAVDEKHRRKGIASKLVNYAQNYFRKKNCKYATIKAEIGLPALKAWESCGFKQKTVELVKKLR